VARNRPQECRELARDCRGCHCGLLALGDKPTIAAAQTSLSFPSDFTDPFRQLCLPTLVAVANPGGVPISPCCLDQGLSRARVTRLGDPALPPCFAGRSLGRYQPEERHQLPRMVEPTNVASLRNKRRSSQKTNPAHRLERRNYGSHRPSRNNLHESCLETIDTLRSRANRVEHFPVCQALRRMLKVLRI